MYVAAALHVFLPCLDGGVVGQVFGRRHVVAVIELPVGKDVDTGGGDIDVAPLHHHLPLIEAVGKRLRDDADGVAPAFLGQEVPASEGGNPEAEIQHVEAEHKILLAVGLNERVVGIVQPCDHVRGLRRRQTFEHVAGNIPFRSGIFDDLAGETRIVRGIDGCGKIERRPAVFRTVGDGVAPRKMVRRVSPVPPVPDHGVFGGGLAEFAQSGGVAAVEDGAVGHGGYEIRKRRDHDGEHEDDRRRAVEQVRPDHVKRAGQAPAPLTPEPDDEHGEKAPHDYEMEPSE